MLRKIVDTLLGSDDLVGMLWKVEHITAVINNASKISVVSLVLSTELKAAYVV